MWWESLAFIHLSLPMVPSSAVWTNDVTCHPEAIHMESMSTGARAQYVVTGAARQLVASMLWWILRIDCRCVVETVARWCACRSP